MRIGFGYDVHRLVEQRDLVLGGVAIPYHKGLEGHSDADVLIHALCDAILGAASLGDLGALFPDTEPAYKDIASTLLLKEVIKHISRQDLKISNADLTLVAQEPKIRPYVDKMKKNIAQICKVSEKRINIKATTTEGLGFAGAKEGMAAYAVVLLRAGA